MEEFFKKNKMSHFDSFTHFAKNTLIFSQEEMQKLGEKKVQTHHLLLGILRQPKSVGGSVLQQFGVTYENAFSIAKEFKNSEKQKEKNSNIFSTFSQKIIEIAAQSALDFGHSMIDSEHILFALLQKKDSAAVHILETLFVKPEQILEYLENIFKKKSGGTKTAPSTNEQINSFLGGLHGVLMGIAREINEKEKNPENLDEKKIRSSRKKKMALDYFCEDFTEMAMTGEIGKIVGRKKEIERMVRILSRKNKNNPVLLGDPGVGKTAIAEGLAQKIIEGGVPDSLMDKKILSLSISNLVAGTKYRGEFEERIKKVIEEASDSENEVILFIDELHTIIGAGSTEGSLDAANILKPALSRGRIQIIGATTVEEYRKHIEKDAALARRFQPIDVFEPNENEAIEILSGVKKNFESHHCVKISNEAILAAVKFSARYIPDRFLPDKAFDLIDEACTLKSISVQKNSKKIRELRKKLSAILRKKETAVIAQNYEKANKLHGEEQKIENEIQQLKNKKISKQPAKKIEATDVAKILEQITGIPMTNFLSSEMKNLQNLEKILEEKIIGQKNAIEKISKIIRRSRLGLQNPARPLGAFLFLGPTGVGKTELVKIIAEKIYHDEKNLIKVDMSEFSESHTSSRLTGATAGYIGHENGGELTEKIRRRPHSIVLFDEIEKAHKNVHNLLLQILEDGKITDGKGREISFKNAIVILTSNAGAARFQKNANSIGFSDNQKKLLEHEHDFEIAAAEAKKDLRQIFSAEFLNRLDSTIVFHPLDRNSIKKIIKLQISEFENRLADRKIKLKIGGNVVNSLAKIAFNPDTGAREVRRVLLEKLEHPLVENLISGKISDNQKIKISFCAKNKKCVFEKIK